MSDDHPVGSLSLSRSPSPPLFLEECRSHAPNFSSFLYEEEAKNNKNKKAKRKKPNENIKYAKWKKLAQ